MPGVKVVIQRASIAQMVERKTLNLVVVGSIPTGGAPFWIGGGAGRLPLNPTGRPPSFDHTMVKAPDPIRTPKLSTIGPAQYCGGGPRGNRRCRMFLPFWNRIPRNFNPP